MKAQELKMPGVLTSDVVFVYGALRSGTTVFRLMLEAHPDIANPGEADFLFDHLKRESSGVWHYDRQRLAQDRMFEAMSLTLPSGKDGLGLLADLLAQFKARAPGLVVTLNLHRNLDRLLAVVPEAKLIHMVRDPRDVAQSSIGMGWAGTLYHGADHWIATETAWDVQKPRLSPGQVFEFSYETLFADVEATLHRTCDFLGLEYTPAMLGYYQSTTYAPPNAALANQWKRRANRADLAPLEAKAARLMRNLGYALSGPLAPPSRGQRARLFVTNKIAVWRFGAKRFGIGLYWAEKLTRRLGLSVLHRRIMSRMKEIERQHLK
jgi:hypothetical protein